MSDPTTAGTGADAQGAAPPAGTTTTPTSTAQGPGATAPPAPALEPAAPPEPPTLTELKSVARELGIEGRSGMDREELEAAIAEATAERTPHTAFADVMGALFSDADVDRPATAEEVGRPDLITVAQARAAGRASRLRNRS